MSFTIFQNGKSPFQAIKTRPSKSRKIDIFPKGVTDGFGPKIAIYSNLLFQAIQTRKMFFIIIKNEKTLFQAIKTRSSKSRIIDIFPNRLTHDFGPKMPIFQTFFFRNIGQENVFYDILGVQNGPFLQLFFLGKIGQENVFYDILGRKNAFLGNKMKKFKKSKN